MDLSLESLSAETKEPRLSIKAIFPSESFHIEFIIALFNIILSWSHYIENAF